MAPHPTSARERPLRADAQRNRDRIVAATRAAFAEAGLQIGVEEIARRAGVGMGTLYRHFPTKDALIAAVVDARFIELTAAADEALRAEDAWDGFASFLEQAVALQVADRGFKDALAARRGDEHALAARRRRFRTAVVALIDRAQASGRLRPDVTYEDISVLLWSTGHIVDRTAAVAPTQWRRFLGIALDGLRADRAMPLDEPPLTPHQHRAAMAHKRR